MSEIKHILRQMIDNNKPHWKTDTINDAHKILDEHEAKAKAFDELVDAINSASNPGQNGMRYIDVFDFTRKAEDIMNKYERAGRNEM